MTRSTALWYAPVGNTGDEILQILDVIVADIESEKTMNEITDFVLRVILRGFLPFFVSTVTLNV